MRSRRRPVGPPLAPADERLATLLRGLVLGAFAGAILAGAWLRRVGRH
jgi:hypothetical protein